MCSWSHNRYQSDGSWRVSIFGLSAKNGKWRRPRERVSNKFYDSHARKRLRWLSDSWEIARKRDVSEVLIVASVGFSEKAVTTSCLFTFIFYFILLLLFFCRNVMSHCMRTQTKRFIKANVSQKKVHWRHPAGLNNRRSHNRFARKRRKRSKFPFDGVTVTRLAFAFFIHPLRKLCYITTALSTWISFINPKRLCFRPSTPLQTEAPKHQNSCAGCPHESCISTRFFLLSHAQFTSQKLLWLN